MHAPKVSIIVPNYNYDCYLTERLESIAQQTYQDFEIILLDDHSTDGSRKIIQEFAAKETRVAHVIFNEQNSGSPFAQWKKGLDYAQGEYIWIAEADDSADIHFIEYLLNYLEMYPQATLATSASVMIGKNGNILQKDYDHWRRRKHIHKRKATLYNGVEFVCHNMYWRNWIYNASGVIFKKKAIDEQALAALNMRYSGDWLFWINIAMQGKIIEVHQRLNYFRFHGNSVTHQGEFQGCLEDIAIINKLNLVFKIKWFKHTVRAGRFYRRTKKLQLSVKQKHDIYQQIKSTFNINKSIAFIIDTLSKCCPILPSEKQDNIKGTAITIHQ